MLLEDKFYRDPRTKLIAVSSLVATQLKSHFNRHDISVIPNAVDTDQFTPEARIARRELSRKALSYAHTDFVLLLIGNDFKKKGLDTLLSAIALLKALPLRLLVVGSDEPGLYRPLVDGLGLQGQVRFEAPSRDVLSFYGAADLYTGPSLEDAFVSPILEAMACGLPSITSARAGVSDLIRDGETGFILRNPKDHLTLASLIRSIQADTTSNVGRNCCCSVCGEELQLG